MRCGNTAVEILDLAHDGRQSCIATLAAGLAAQCECNCAPENVAMACTPTCAESSSSRAKSEIVRKDLQEAEVDSDGAKHPGVDTSQAKEEHLSRWQWFL